jgi:hypothetical protein
MNTQALTELRRVIAAVPDQLLIMDAIRTDVPCGTAYCALGWAAADAWFRTHTRIAAHLRYSEIQQSVVIETQAALQELATTTFNLSITDAIRMFDLTATASQNTTKQEVLDNIDRLLQGKHAKPYRTRFEDQAGVFPDDEDWDDDDVEDEADDVDDDDDDDEDFDDIEDDECDDDDDDWDDDYGDEDDDDDDEGDPNWVAEEADESEVSIDEAEAFGFDDETGTGTMQVDNAEWKPNNE